jgi:uncharacterized repeat protein (TIGR02543 family)
MNIFKKVTRCLWLLTMLLAFSFSAQASSSLSLSPDLKLGDTSPFVLQLQKFLNSNNFKVNSSAGAPGSVSFETNKFGALTKLALTKFQSAFNVPATGYFGPKTKAKISEMVDSGKVKDVSIAPATQGILSSVNDDDCGVNEARAITQNGITWTFPGCVRYGTFATGDYWVLGPVTIQTISPLPAGGQNGFDINPVGISGPGMTYFSGINTYSEANAPQTLPRVVSGSESVVSTITRTDTNCVKGGEAGHFTPWNVCSRAYIKSAAVLTVLNTVPPNNGTTSFRPAYAGTDKTLYSVNSLQTSLLKTLPPVSDTPDITALARKFERVQLDHYTGSNGGYMHPFENIDNFGADITNAVGEAMLRLSLDDPLADKMPLLIGIVQSGIDHYGMIQADMDWYTDGGHSSGRKIQVLFAGLMLNNQAMKNVSSLRTFAEDCQTFYTPDNPPVFTDGVNTSLYVPVSTAFLTPSGYARYGILHCYMMENPATLSNLLAKHQVGEDVTGYLLKTYYTTNFPSWVGEALVVRLYDLEALWNHSAFLDLVDRALTEPLSSSGYWNTFNNNMYTAYRDGIDTTTSTLSTFVSTAGLGTITSSPSGINCGSDCSETYTTANNTVVTLTAVPTGSATFTGWSGSCAGTGTCTLTMNANKSATANFTMPSIELSIGGRMAVSNAYGVNVRSYPFIDGTSKIGTQAVGSAGKIIGGPEYSNDTNGTQVTWWYVNYDSGVDGWSGQDNLTATTQGNSTTYTVTISTSAGGVVYGETSYESGSTVILTPLPNTGYTFSGWSGDCTNSSGTCSLTMNANKSVTANFSNGPATTYTLTTSVSGSGTISGNTSPYASGATAVLTAVPNTGYTFSGWSGDCTNSSGTCSLTMNANKSVTASFTAIPANTDDDNDGIENSIDKCPNTPNTLTSDKINQYGCPKPVTTALTLITNVQTADITNIPNFEFQNSGQTLFAKIRYNQAVNIFGTSDMTSQINLDSYITLASKRVTIDSVSGAQFDKSATITLYGINLIKPSIMKDGELCDECTNVVYDSNAKTLTFTVPGFSSYEVFEDGDVTYNLTASKDGTGTGTITSGDGGINCGSTCSGTYTENTSVTLTAVPDSGSTFGGWSGACTGTGTCTFTITSNSTVKATFTKTIVTDKNNTNSSNNKKNSDNGARNTTPPPTTTSLKFLRNLSFGVQDLDVKNLQIWLNSKGYTVSTTGAGSKGNETTYFGNATISALKRLQAFAKLPTTGNLDEATRNYINAQGGLITTPISANNQALIATLQKQLNALIALLQSMLAQQGSTISIPNTSSNLLFNRNLFVNMQDPDVKRLQLWLNSHGYTIATEGPGSPGNESDRFGNATIAALKKFQAYVGVPQSGGLDEATRAKMK